MWSWLERFFKSLQADIQEESESKQPRVPSSSKQPQTRTKSIYPRERERTRTKAEQDELIRGQFRFPVIPDRTKSQSRRKEAVDVESPFEVYKQKQTRDRSDEALKQASTKQESTASKQVKALSHEKESAAFEPTQILSPIYGKIDPNKTVPIDHQLLFQGKEEAIQDVQEIQTAPKVEEAQVVEEAQEVQEVQTVHEVLEVQEVQAVQEVHFAQNEQVQEEIQAYGLTEQTTEIYSMNEEVESVEELDNEMEETVGETIEEASPVDERFVVEAIEEVEVREVDEEEVKEIDEIEEEIVETVAFEAESSIQQVAVGAERVEEVAPFIPVKSPEEVIVPVAIHEITSVTRPDFTQVSRPESTHVTRPEIAPVAIPEITSHSSSEPVDSEYEFPSLSLLDSPPVLSDDSYEYTLQQKQLLEETLGNFHVNAQVVGIVKGPAVTRFELQPAPGVKVNKITGLSDDIKLNLAAKDIRIEAPIPGRNAVGIEVPNLKSEPIFLRRIIGSEKFQNHPSPLAIALGMDIGGEPIVADIKKMPHGLIAGSTGSGKSVCINSIIVSLLYKATPEQVRLLLIDPKMVELAPYNHLPHLVTPVVTDAKQATASLKWAVEEMEKRYALFVDAGVRDIDRYNKQADQELPYIVIIIDELADLMMVSPQDVEDCIIRIAQKARACGIHLLLATQRPSVDVITGNIKANVPTRLAFAVFSQIDSRTILDQSGAERLLGRGDMLFLESGTTPIRLQGNYVSDDEIDRVTELIKNQRKPAYLFSKEDLEQSVNSYDMGDDSLFHEALVFVAEQGQASASSLQRRFRIGYNRAARLIDMMEAEGFIAGQSGGKPRAVLITVEDAQAMADGSTLL